MKLVINLKLDFQQDGEKAKPTKVAPYIRVRNGKKLFYWFKVSIRFIWVEDFVTVHYCHKILSIGQVDNVVGITWKHVYCLYLITTYLKVENFVGIDAALLNKTVTADYDEELPFGIVPVLTFGDAWLADVDADLTAVQSVNKFCKGSPVIYIHLEWERHF